MHKITRLLSLATVTAALAAPAAGAQSLATYGGLELSGLGEGNGVLGVSITSGMLGWHPTINANVQRYTFRTGTGTASRNAFVPSLGMQYRAHDGSFGGSVGYAFVGGGDNAVPVIGVGGTGGGTSGVVLGLQGNYWGNQQEHQAILSYNTKSEYYWTRFRAAHQINPHTRDVPVYLGAELVYQGGPVKNLTPQVNVHRLQVGPTINFHFTPNFHLGFQGGVTTRDPSGTSGYARVEFLSLSSF